MENCRLNSPNLNEAFRFKTNAMRGGIIENVYFRNITIGEVSDAILQVDFYYQEGAKGPEHPVVRNIDIRDVTSKKSKYALQLRGFPDAPMNNIHFERCDFDNVANAGRCGKREGSDGDRRQGERQSSRLRYDMTISRHTQESFQHMKFDRIYDKNISSTERGGSISRSAMSLLNAQAPGGGGSGFGGRGGSGRGAFGRGGGGFGGRGGGIGTPVFNALDADKDGSLTRAEFKAGLDSWFSAADTAKGGVLTNDQLLKGLLVTFPVTATTGGFDA